MKKSRTDRESQRSNGRAYCWWIKYSRAMEVTYHTDSFRNLSINPDWKFGDAAVLKEYTDLGGIGIPDNK